jgi:hypothetical protein
LTLNNNHAFTHNILDLQTRDLEFDMMKFIFVQINFLDTQLQ